MSHRRLPLVRPTVLLVLSAGAALCSCAARPALEPESGSPHFRAYEARPAENIFTEISLPAPNLMRTAAGAPGVDYWQQQADYVIETEFDPESRLLRGKERITYTNNSPDVLDYVWLHLEQNVFRADSIGASVGARTGVAVEEPEGDGLILGTIRSGDRELTHTVYDTLVRIELEETLTAAGGVVELDIEWEFTVAENVFRRHGIEHVEQGVIIEIAQWFPALAVYDDVHGWNTLPYIGSGEFYSNLGNYDVRITMPHEFVVLATGELQNEADVYTSEQRERLARARTSAETVDIISPDEVGTESARPAGTEPLSWHFQAQRVRTFAWAASDAFIIDAAAVDDVLCISAYPKEGRELWQKATQMARASIGGYSKRLYPYPYPLAININGIEGGMEYPMIVFCSERESERWLYDVTSHEFAHAWFPMLVNTDERRHAWMDEGFNTFMNHYSFGDWFEGEEPTQSDPVQFVLDMPPGDWLPIMTPPDQFDDEQLGWLVYSKPGVGLVILREAVLGPERFDYAFRDYIARWAYKSPQPADFFRCMENAAGVDLSWFWRGWFMETGTLDQAVLDVRQPGSEDFGVIAFANRGDLVMPLEYEIRFADGSSVRKRLPVEVWFGSDRIYEKVECPAAIRWVEIDPDGLLPDVERGNNDWAY